jgi:hypothetical protein
MGEQGATAIGRCGSCSKPIYQMTPVGNVLLGFPPRAYIAHKDCADKVELESQPVVVTTREEILDGIGKIDELPPAIESSKPVGEQKGRRRGKVAGHGSD